MLTHSYVRERLEEIAELPAGERAAALNRLYRATSPGSEAEEAVEEAAVAALPAVAELPAFERVEALLDLSDATSLDSPAMTTVDEALHEAIVDED